MRERCSDRKRAVINVIPPGMTYQFMYEGEEANDLFLRVCRWCDKSPTPMDILRAACPDFADPPHLKRDRWPIICGTLNLYVCLQWWVQALCTESNTLMTVLCTAALWCKCLISLIPGGLSIGRANGSWMHTSPVAINTMLSTFPLNVLYTSNPFIHFQARIEWH